MTGRRWWRREFMLILIIGWLRCMMTADLCEIQTTCGQRTTMVELFGTLTQSSICTKANQFKLCRGGFFFFFQFSIRFSFNIYVTRFTKDPNSKTCFSTLWTKRLELYLEIVRGVETLGWGRKDGLLVPKRGRQGVLVVMKSSQTHMKNVSSVL